MVAGSNPVPPTILLHILCLSVWIDAISLHRDSRGITTLITGRSDLKNNSLIGTLLFLAAFSVMPAMDSIAKHLSEHLTLAQVTWGRYFFHFLFLAPVVLYRYGLQALKPERFFLQVLRGGFLLAATLFFFGAIAVMPLADALAIAFVSPFLVTIMSPVFLGERIGLFRISAVLIGFIGTLIIIRPGEGAISIGALMALGTGMMYAFYSISTRKLAGTAPPIVTLTFTALLGSTVMSIAVPFFWSPLGSTDILWMIGMGFFGALAHYFFIKAYDYAEASFLAPFAYSEIVSATLFGLIVFGDFPDAWTWSGTIVVITSGIFISVRERYRTRQQQVSAPGVPPNT